MKNSIFLLLYFFCSFVVFCQSRKKKHYFNGETFFIVPLDAVHSSFVLILIPYIFSTFHGGQSTKNNAKKKIYIYINIYTAALLLVLAVPSKANALSKKTKKKQTILAHLVIISAQTDAALRPRWFKHEVEIYKTNRCNAGFTCMDEDLERHCHFYLFVSCFFLGCFCFLIIPPKKLFLYCDTVAIHTHD